MKKPIVFLSIAFLASAIMISSCRKNNIKTTVEDDGGFGADNAKSEQIYSDVQNISEEAISGNNLTGYKTTQNSGSMILSACATITHDTVSIPHTTTIDFGTVNCLCNDGRYRRGQIIISHTGALIDSGSVRSISFNNYFVNDNQVLGSKVITNMGHNNNNQMFFTVVTNGTIVLANGNGNRTWTCNRIRTWVSGGNTPAKIDDVFEVTGTSTLTKPSGNGFNINIQSPLVIARNCQWIKSGVVQIVPFSTNTNQTVRSIDYGNGTCDNQATLTVGNNSTTITLP